MSNRKEMAKITGSAEQRGRVHTGLPPVSERCLEEGWRSSSRQRASHPGDTSLWGAACALGKSWSPRRGSQEFPALKLHRLSLGRSRSCGLLRPPFTSPVL